MDNASIHGNGARRLNLLVVIAHDLGRFLGCHGRQEVRSPHVDAFAQVGFFEQHRPFPHDGMESKDPAEMRIPGYLPDIPEVRRELAEMEASVAAMDRAFGRVLNALHQSGLEEETIVSFTADHGIPFPCAKMSLYDPGLEIPFLIRMPGHEAQHIGEMISNIDAFRTFLELLGLDIPTGTQGRSFAPLLLGKNSCQPRSEVFGEKTYHTYYDPMRCIRTDRWKLIANFEHTGLPNEEFRMKQCVHAGF